MPLVDNIKILKSNDYRISDIVTKMGPRWKQSGKRVLRNNNYNNSILQHYLKLNGLLLPSNFYTLLDIIENYNQKNKLPIPTNNEIVIHLRLGDVVVLDWFLNKDYLKSIKQILISSKNIDKITFVTCFVYHKWYTDLANTWEYGKVPLWDYTEEKQKRNISEVTRFFEKIQNHFPTLELKVCSNENIDIDFCYCVLAEHFIGDFGGFGKLCRDLNTLRRDMKQMQFTTQ
jgi:hypothetical protein